jgi:exopolysaccharide biosynthesis WecB/TagA/CpsF family protein
VLCIGAAVEFALGLKKRAPNLVSRLGLEWAHRLAQEPHRLWRRYLVTGPKVFVIFARELLADTLSQRG